MMDNMDNYEMRTIVTTPNPTELYLERTFDAKRELVWKAYTNAEMLKKWWGPEGWTLPVCEVDFRVGGEWFYCMQSPPEMDMTSCGVAVYTEISEPERLGYEDKFADEDGNANEELPVSKTLVILEEVDGKTILKSTSTYETQALRDQIVEMGVTYGIDQTFNRLEDFLKELK